MLRDDLSITDYLALLITSLEAEENERYMEGVIQSIAFNDPKKLKKLKPNHKKIGKRRDPAQALAAFALAAAKGNATPNGSAIDHAKATGREVVYRGPDGILRDAAGRQVERDPWKQVVINGYPN